MQRARWDGRDRVKANYLAPFDVASGRERRSAERTATLFRPVLIEADGFAGFCLVRNLSLLGLMGDVYTNFADGQRITIHFGHSEVATGVLKWCKDGRIGVE